MVSKRVCAEYLRTTPLAVPFLFMILFTGCNRPKAQVAAVQAAEVHEHSSSDMPDRDTAIVPKRNWSGGQGGKTGTFPNEQIAVGANKRIFRLVVPQKVDPKEAAPLLFAFHGLGDSKDLMPLYSKLDGLAAEEGFILAYPNGKGRYWPVVPEWAADELAFFDALYSELSAKYNIDLNRVYLTGMSNGAFFTHVIASQRSDKIAAIAPHSGGLGAFAAREINVKHKYPVMVIHGASDSIVSIEEGRKTRDAYLKWGHEVEYLEVPDLNHFWAHKADVNHKMWSFFSAHPLGPE